MDSAPSRQPVHLPALLALAGILVLSLSAPLMEISRALPPAYGAARPYAFPACFALAATSFYPFTWKKVAQIAPLPVLLVLAWCWISLGWSANLGDSLRKVTLTTLVVLTIFMALGKAGYRQSLVLVRTILGIALSLNWLSMALFPDLSAHFNKVDAEWWWRGLLADKNIAGMVCGLTVIVFAFDARRLPHFIRWPVIALASVFLFNSHSRTSMAACLIALLVGAGIHYGAGGNLGRFLRGRATAIRWVAIATIGLLLAVLLVLTLEQTTLIGLTDDGAAFSSRNALWRPMLQFYVDHPLSGSGYGSFWEARSDVRLSEEFAGNTWLSGIDQAHNGYLEMLVQIGLPGLALVLVAVLVWPAAHLATIIDRQPQRGALAYAVLVFCLVDNTMESSLFIRDTICNVFLIISLAFIRRLASGFRPEAAQAPIESVMRKAAALRQQRVERSRSR